MNFLEAASSPPHLKQDACDKNEKRTEIDANERAAIGKRNAAFSFAPSSILSLTIMYVRREKHGCSVETVCLLTHKG